MFPKIKESLDKYYCIDNGLRGAVLIPQSNDNGKNLENTIFMHLNRNRLPTDKIPYDQGKTECDFVIQREDRVVQLIQVTWSMAGETREREIKGLMEAASVTDRDNLLIITDDEEDMLVKDGREIHLTPAWKWLLKENPTRF